MGLQIVNFVSNFQLFFFSSYFKLPFRTWGTPLSLVWETLVFLCAGTEQQCVGHRRGNPADARHNQGEAQLAAKLFVDVAVKRIVLWPLSLCDVADDVVFIACAQRMAPSCHIVHLLLVLEWFLLLATFLSFSSPWQSAEREKNTLNSECCGCFGRWVTWPWRTTRSGVWRALWPMSS